MLNWQETKSWQNRLFKEISFEELSDLQQKFVRKTTFENDKEYLLFHKKDFSLPFSAQNLNFLPFNTLLDRSRKDKVLIVLVDKSEQKLSLPYYDVNGSHLVANLFYKVEDSKRSLMKVEDVITELERLCYVTTQKAFSKEVVTQNTLTNEIRDIDFASIGLELIRFSIEKFNVAQRGRTEKELQELEKELDKKQADLAKLEISLAQQLKDLQAEKQSLSEQREELKLREHDLEKEKALLSAQKRELEEKENALKQEQEALSIREDDLAIQQHYFEEQQNFKNKVDKETLLKNKLPDTHVIVVFKTKYKVLQNEIYERVDIQNLGFGYIFSNCYGNDKAKEEQQNVLTELLDYYHNKKNILLVPDYLQSSIPSILQKINKQYEVQWSDYDKSGFDEPVTALLQEKIKSRAAATNLKDKSVALGEIKFLSVFNSQEIFPTSISKEKILRKTVEELLKKNATLSSYTSSDEMKKFSTKIEKLMESRLPKSSFLEELSQQNRVFFIKGMGLGTVLGFIFIMFIWILI